MFCKEGFDEPIHESDQPLPQERNLLLRHLQPSELNRLTRLNIKSYFSKLKHVYPLPVGGTEQAKIAPANIG